MCRSGRGADLLCSFPNPMCVPIMIDGFMRVYCAFTYKPRDMKVPVVQCQTAKGLFVQHDEPHHLNECV